MKADNKPATSLSVYYKSIKKWKYVLKKSKTKQNKTAGKKEETFSSGAGVEPRTFDVWGQRVIYCTTTANVPIASLLN